MQMRAQQSKTSVRKRGGSSDVEKGSVVVNNKWFDEKNNFTLADLDWQDILNVSSHFDGMDRKSWGWGMGVTRLWNNKPQRVDPGISKPGALSRRGRTFWVWGLFCCPFTYSHIPYLFVVREEKNIYMVYIACWLRLIYMRIMQSKFSKRNGEIPNFLSNSSGEGGGGAWSWIRLCRHTYNSKYAQFFYGGDAVTTPFLLNPPAAN